MALRDGFKPLLPGVGRRLRRGSQVAVLSFGPIGNYVTEAAERLEEEGVSLGHYDMRYAKPLERALIDEAVVADDHLITLADGARRGGVGSAVSEYVATRAGWVAGAMMGGL